MVRSSVNLERFIPPPPARADSTQNWIGSRGSRRYQGATLHSELAGAGTGVNASVTFAGVSLADAQSKFTTSTGSMGTNSYLQITYTG